MSGSRTDAPLSFPLHRWQRPDRGQDVEIGLPRQWTRDHAPGTGDERLVGLWIPEDFVCARGYGTLALAG